MSKNQRQPCMFDPSGNRLRINIHINMWTTCTRPMIEAVIREAESNILKFRELASTARGTSALNNLVQSIDANITMRDRAKQILQDGDALHQSYITKK